MEIDPDIIHAALRIFKDALITQEEVMKHPLRRIGILVGVVSTVIGGAVAAQEPETSFMIVNAGSGMCLERNGDGWGEPILQQPCYTDPTHPNIARQLGSQRCHRHA